MRVRPLFFYNEPADTRFQKIRIKIKSHPRMLIFSIRKCLLQLFSPNNVKHLCEIHVYNNVDLGIFLLDENYSNQTKSKIRNVTIPNNDGLIDSIHTFCVTACCLMIEK